MNNDITKNKRRSNSEGIERGCTYVSSIVYNKISDLTAMLQWIIGRYQNMVELYIASLLP